MSTPNASGAAPGKPASNCRCLMIFLIFMMMVLNFVDRVNFSVAAPSIMKEFDMNASEMGLLMSAFFIPYLGMMLPSGWLVNKFGPRIVVTGALIGWGMVTMVTSMASSVTSFVVVRGLMGLTESPGFPAATRVVSVWTPPHERTLASAIFNSGARIGSAFTPPLVAWIIVTWGWRSSFVITGALAVIYSAIWHVLYKDPEEHPRITKSEMDYIRQAEVVDSSGVVVSEPIPMRRLFGYPPFMKACLGMAAYMYVWTVFLYWIPSYFVNAKGFTMQAMGIAAMIPHAVSVVTEVGGGAYFDRWLRLGKANLSVIRRTGMGICLIGSAIFIYLSTLVDDNLMSVLCITLYAGISGFGASNVQAIPSDYAPYGQAGGTSAVYVFIGNLGAFAAPIVTGFIVDSQYGYNGAFTVAAVVCLVGAYLYIFNVYERLRPREAAAQAA